jgi:hypothetical protein
MEALGPVLVLVSIPLLFGWVPRNRLYAVWYDVNARSARHFLLLGSGMVALEFVLPRPHRTEVLSAMAVVGLAIITVVNWRRANRLARELGV